MADKRIDALLLRNVVLFSSIGLGSSFAQRPSPPIDAPPSVIANDNRHPAGSLQNGVLTIRLVAAVARWYPEADTGAFVDVPVLSEEGGPPQIPAPLIRVPAGTTVDATIHNTLDSTIYMWGLSTKPARVYDSIPILPGETRAIRFAAGAIGTYHYAASVGIPKFGIIPEERTAEGQQMAGALVVDEPGALINDRIFVVNIWGHRIDAATYRNVLAINGKSWPYTERIAANVGDTLRWRVVNPSLRNHPMHLHGFYFRVDSHGIPIRDSIYSPVERRYAVTEDLATLHSISIVWTPNRPGNWLFHCHLAFHVVPPEARLDATNAGHEAHQGDPAKHMAGLVIGINVQPTTAYRDAARVNPRQLRLFVDEGKPRHAAPRALGYVLQRGRRRPAADSVEIPGTTLVLTRGQPTDITVVNRLKESTAVHWHGRELESYSDGVAGWSGSANQLAPSIAPGASFRARLTMPRAGTFIYHTHINDIEQITSGLYGAIVVLEPNQRFDPRTDHLFVVGWDGVTPRRGPPRFVVNGDSASAPLELRFGVSHRLRFINIGAGGRVFFAIRQDSTLLKWRRLAKDGAALPSTVAVMAPATQRLNAGEMFDAEFTPPQKGEYVLAISSPLSPARTYRRKIIVR